MSDLQQVKEQLHQIAVDSKKTAAGLASFREKFAKDGQKIRGLIEGTASGADKDIIQILHAAGEALQHAIDALQIAADGCRSYAEQA